MASQGDGKIYLYKAGDESVALTGGWGNQTFQAQGTHTFTKNASNMSFVTNNTIQRVRTANLMDLTPYTKLYYKYSTLTNNVNSGYNDAYLGVTISTTDVWADADATRSVHDGYTVTTQTDITKFFDISHINSNNYVAIGSMAGYAAVTNTLTVTEVWFE